MNSDIIGHLKKVNKNAFWVKASYMNMEGPIEMKQKGLFRGHPKISKKSKNPPLRVKIKGDMHCQSWLFLEICPKSTMLKTTFFLK